MKLSWYCICGQFSDMALGQETIGMMGSVTNRGIVTVTKCLQMQTIVTQNKSVGWI